MNLKKTSNIIYLGSPDFAVEPLRALILAGYKPDAVITQPDKPVGRKMLLASSAVKIFADQNDIAVFQPKSKKELTHIFLNHQYDLAVLVAYGFIIPDDILESPRYGFLNIHPSLLPIYRGSSPIQQAILNNDDKTGVSIIKLTAKMDAGPIVAQQELEITNEDTLKSLSEKLSTLGASMIKDLVPKYISSQALVAMQYQDEAQATYTKKISREDGQIDWTQPAEYIERKFRAYFPWPGVYSFYSGQRIKFLKLGIFTGEIPKEIETGSFFSSNNELCIKCGRGALVIEVLQVEGKKSVSAWIFLQGNDIVGKKLDIRR